MHTIFRVIQDTRVRSMGLCVLAACVLGHAWIAVRGPDPSGALFGFGPLVEALGQSLLLVGPPFALLCGILGARRDRDDLLAYVSLTGGGLLSLVTGVGLWLAL